MKKYKYEEKQFLIIQELFDAAEKLDLDRLERLLEEQPEHLNAVNHKKRNLLLSAFMVNLSETPEQRTNLENIVYYLINTAKININFRFKDGKSALYCSIINNQKEIFLFLLGKGAEINNKDKRQVSVLSAAVRVYRKNNEFNFLEYLIEIGANINYKERHYTTILHYAVNCGRFSAIEILIKNKNLDFSITDHNLNTPLSLLLLQGSFSYKYSQKILEKKLIEKFLEHGALLTGKCLENLFFGEKLLLNHININIQDSLGNSLLHIATENTMTYFITQLLELGANKHKTNKAGDSPIYFAFKNNCLDMILYLCQPKNYTAINGSSKTLVQIINEPHRDLSKPSLYNFSYKKSFNFKVTEEKDLPKKPGNLGMKTIKTVRRASL